MKNVDVVLASASPRRQELLHLITDKFTVFPAYIDETVPDGFSGSKVCEFLSLKKGSAVAEKFPDSLVISADTIVVADDLILGKPKDREEAFKMLSLLSGRSHKVFTGCTLCYKGKTETFSEETTVVFYSLSKEEIEEYIDSGDPFDKAGGYGIQTVGALLVKEIMGDYNNVVGLPVARLKREIDRLLNSFS